MAKDWFREQVTALGAEYQVNGTGTQFALFDWGDKSIPPIAMGSHMDTVATGGKFDGPLGVCVFYVTNLTISSSSWANTLASR